MQAEVNSILMHTHLLDVYLLIWLNLSNKQFARRLEMICQYLTPCALGCLVFMCTYSGCVSCLVSIIKTHRKKDYVYLYVKYLGTLDTCTLTQRKWFGCWPCECNKESLSPVTHIDWRIRGGGIGSFFATSRFLLHLSSEISAIIRGCNWWQSQHAPRYII